VRACIKQKFVVNHEKTIKKLIKIAAGRYVVEVLKDGKFIVSKEGETKWFWLLRGRHVRFVFELAQGKYPTLNWILSDRRTFRDRWEMSRGDYKTALAVNELRQIASTGVKL
jgi:hypothetical protein